MPRQPLEFYQNEGITPESTLNESARCLLRNYAQIRDDEQINQHVDQIRTAAFSVAPYPCIGMFQFLDLSLKSFPQVYGEILDRVTRNNHKFLDLGCCLGQEIRQLVLDGAPAANTYGSDLHEGFFSVGYDLFQDSPSAESDGTGKRRLDTTFIAADVFDDQSRLVGQLAGKMDIVYTGAFFHLFTLAEQEKIAARVVQLLVPRAGSLLVGRQSGIGSAETAGEEEDYSGPFRHNVQSWRELWDRVGRATGTTWVVQADVGSPEYSLAGVAEGKSTAMQRKITGPGLRYVIRRV